MESNNKKIPPSSKEIDTGKKEKKKEDKETLYKTLKNVGISNITTLSHYLGITFNKPKPSNENQFDPANPSSSDNTESFDNEGGEHLEQIEKNSKALLRLMGLKDNLDNALVLQKICRRGIEMLGAIPKPTITSTPIGGPDE